jgi:hypothetical protein
MTCKALFETRIKAMKEMVRDRTQHMARCHLEIINTSLETLEFFLGRLDEQPTLAMNRMQAECSLIDDTIKRLT